MRIRCLYPVPISKMMVLHWFGGFALAICSATFVCHSAPACDQCGTVSASAPQHHHACSHGCDRPSPRVFEGILDGLDRCTDRFECSWNSFLNTNRLPRSCDSSCDSWMKSAHGIQLGRPKSNSCDEMGTRSDNVMACDCINSEPSASCGCSSTYLHSKDPWFNGIPVRELNNIVPMTSIPMNSVPMSSVPKAINASPKTLSPDRKTIESSPSVPAKLPDWLNDPFNDEARLRSPSRLPDITNPIEPALAHAFDAQAFITRQKVEDEIRQKLLNRSTDNQNESNRSASAQIPKNNRIPQGLVIRRSISDTSRTIQTASSSPISRSMDSGVVQAASFERLEEVPVNVLR